MTRTVPRMCQRKACAAERALDELVCIVYNQWNLPNIKLYRYKYSQMSVICVEPRLFQKCGILCAALIIHLSVERNTDGWIYIS